MSGVPMPVYMRIPWLPADFLVRCLGWVRGRSEW